jgi:hypothetical protein
MAVNNKRLIEGSLLTASAVSYYAAPASTTTVIKKLTLTNTTATAYVATVYLVPSAGAAGAASQIWTGSVAAGSTVEIYGAENHVLMPGDFIAALCPTTASVNIMASGAEIQ